MIAIDLLTGEQFLKKRCTQKFANRKNQIRFNNLKAKKERAVKRKIDVPLCRNRKILTQLLGMETEITKSKDWLLALGFDFTVYTNTMRLDTAPIPCIYEFCLQKLSNDLYKIFKNGKY